MGLTAVAVGRPAKLILMIADVCQSWRRTNVHDHEGSGRPCHGQATAVPGNAYRGRVLGSVAGHRACDQPAATTAAPASSNAGLRR